MARPFTRLPPGAKSHLEAMAASGMLSKTRAADALGMPLAQFRKVIRENAKAKEIWEGAMDVEKDRLLEALYDRATSGDVNAARTLLAVRHGLSERQPPDNGQDRQPAVHIHLPAAMDADAYAKAIETRPALEDKANGDAGA